MHQQTLFLILLAFLVLVILFALVMGANNNSGKSGNSGNNNGNSGNNVERFVCNRGKGNDTAEKLSQLEALLIDNVYQTYMAINLQKENPQKNTFFERLKENQKQIADCFRYFYGDSAGKKAQQILEKRDDRFRDYVVNILGGGSPSTDSMSQSCEEFASYLSSTAKLDQSKIKTLLKKNRDAVIAAVGAVSLGNVASYNEKLEESVGQMRLIARYVAEGVWQSC